MFRYIKLFAIAGLLALISNLAGSVLVHYLEKDMYQIELAEEDNHEEQKNNQSKRGFSFLEEEMHLSHSLISLELAAAQSAKRARSSNNETLFYSCCHAQVIENPPELC